MYLPRKLKIPIAVPPTNIVGVYAHDIGFIVMVNERGDFGWLQHNNRWWHGCRAR
ncbi:hypothetical protein BGW80DRAFT_1291178 [Lactifluus volemus]|nr:hypothetical protein BGW80DRAFT_1291178 [Lactifluus volemus]